MSSFTMGLRALTLGVVVVGLAACSATSAAPSQTPASAPSATLAPSATPASSGSQLHIVGVEYAFEGVPETVPSGTTLTFSNEGKEVHEMVVVRRKPGVIATWEELLSMPNEEAEAMVETIGMTVAMPGTDAPETVTLETPGEYLMLCLVPTGTTGLASGAPALSGEEAPPHAMQGMLTPFTVVE